MASNAAIKECGVCNEEFDEEVRCPRIFQCSHTLCSSCVDQLIRKNTKQCPFCRRNFQAICSTDITVNHLAIEFIKYISALNSSTKMSSKSRVPPRKRKIEDIQRETRETSSLHFVNCQEAQKKIEKTLKEVIDLQKNIKEENTRIENDVLPIIQNAITQNNRTGEELERIKMELENQLKEVKAKEKVLDDVKGNLNSCRANTFSDAADVLDKAEETNTAIGCWIETFKGLIAEEEAAFRTTQKAIKRTKEKINIIFEVMSSGEEIYGEEIDNIPRIAAMVMQEDNLPTRITLEIIRKMRPQVKQLVAQGRLYAFQDYMGRRSCARISYAENNRLCLHHLREEPLPPNVLIVEHGEVMRLADPSSRQLTFIDLGVGGSTLGRMYIRLHTDDKRAKHFSLLCLGVKGPSYANTNIFVNNCYPDDDNNYDGDDNNDDDNNGDDDNNDDDDDDGDDEYDYICLGDYETNNGEGGKTLVPGVVEEDQMQQLEPRLLGLVSMGRSHATAAQFIIHIRAQNFDLCTSFGMVEEGLSVLTEAISNYSNIREIYIKDCGIVLPF